MKIFKNMRYVDVENKMESNQTAKLNKKNLLYEKNLCFVLPFICEPNVTSQQKETNEEWKT